MMKQEDIKTIEKLLDRYLDGDTTNDEERLLHRLFAQAGDDIPEAWRAYRSLFAFEDAEAEPMADRETTGESQARIIPIATPVSKRRWLKTAVACAAAVLVVGGIIPFLTGPRPSTPQEEGASNYAVIDGRRITDSATVKQQALEALNTVSADRDEDFAAMME
jgi:hypothetical protein